jgi:hypothetical protein
MRIRTIPGVGLKALSRLADQDSVSTIVRPNASPIGCGSGGNTCILDVSVVANSIIGLLPSRLRAYRNGGLTR